LAIYLEKVIVEIKKQTKPGIMIIKAFALLVPFGILDVLGNKLWIYFGESKETSDFIVDCGSSVPFMQINN